MSEYRRFISYMYLYEDGRKTINSGFVRVESRNGECRISVHMEGVGNNKNGSYQMYMLIRDASDYIGIAAGELMIRQQKGNMELVMDSHHLMGTEYALDHVTGMVLLREDGSVYGTRWDDEPLETYKFLSSKQLSSNLVRFGHQGYADENPLIPEEEMTIEEHSPILEKEVTASESLSVPEEAFTMNAYEQLMTELPQMYPFEEDSVISCVRLELQDIGRMPMTCWAYGGNSFLLHGYYCYRHLILAKASLNKDLAKQPIYLIGVPGIWQHREQYMASMFGFRDFRPVSREEPRSGAFGYWCAELKA